MCGVWWWSGGPCFVRPSLPLLARGLTSSHAAPFLLLHHSPFHSIISPPLCLSFSNPRFPSSFVLHSSFSFLVRSRSCLPFPPQLQCSYSSHESSSFSAPHSNQLSICSPSPLHSSSFHSVDPREGPIVPRSSIAGLFCGSGLAKFIPFTRAMDSASGPTAGWSSGAGECGAATRRRSRVDPIPSTRIVSDCKLN